LPAAQVEAALAALELRAGGYYVLAPGAEYGPAKRWPAIHFAELARVLERPAVLLGSGKEADLCQEIAGTAGHGNCLNLAGKTSLLQAFALISAAKAVISNDSGLMHVAAAFGVPQVAVFGSSSALHTPPLNDKAQVLWLKQDESYQPPLDCSPCFQRECPLGHTRCLYDVTPERVLATVKRAVQ
jgi:heptosyltransferase-2